MPWRRGSAEVAARGIASTKPRPRPAFRRTRVYFGGIGTRRWKAPLSAPLPTAISSVRSWPTLKAALNSYGSRPPSTSRLDITLLSGGYFGRPRIGATDAGSARRRAALMGSTCCWCFERRASFYTLELKVERPSRPAETCCATSVCDRSGDVLISRALRVLAAQARPAALQSSRLVVR